MKKYIFYISFLLTCIFLYKNVNAQCISDPTCNDVGNPGEICPEILPPATVNIPYSQVVTVIPPSSFVYNGQTVNLNKIKVSKVENLPTGLSYQCNPSNCEFSVTNPPTRYCILLSGTPTTAGTYPLKIYVIPYITVFGTPTALPEQVDDTSLVMIVNQSSSYDIVSANKFTVLNPQPNPFTSSVKISIYSTSNQSIVLQIFDILGNRVYEEKATVGKGEFTFKFDGISLKKGMYVYTITNGKENFVKQLIKN